MKFPYTKFREHLSSGELTTILRPVIPLGVRHKGRMLPALYAALLDSGADDCIFHAEIGEVLGMDVRSGAAKKYGGVGFGELEGYLHQIEIQVGGYWLACEVALTYGMLRDHPGLPGKKQGVPLWHPRAEGFLRAVQSHLRLLSGRDRASAEIEYNSEA